MSSCYDIKHGGLYHYSKHNLTALKSASFSRNQDVNDKPKGLWVSVEDAWEEWCKEQEYQLSHLKVKVKVELLAYNNVLWLYTEEEFEEFQCLFGVSRYDSLLINWRKVAEEYGGIIISPYFWGFRLASNSLWYYGWDCASGCIWNEEEVENLEETK